MHYTVNLLRKEKKIYYNKESHWLQVSPTKIQGDLSGNTKLIFGQNLQKRSKIENSEHQYNIFHTQISLLLSA